MAENMMSNLTGKAKKAVNAKRGTELPTAVVEEVGKQIPNVGFLGLGLVALGASAILGFSYKKKDLANFVGLWVPTILLFGVYNKITKLEDELILKDEDFIRH